MYFQIRSNFRYISLIYFKILKSLHRCRSRVGSIAYPVPLCSQKKGNTHAWCYKVQYYSNDRYKPMRVGFIKFHVSNAVSVIINYDIHMSKCIFRTRVGYNLAPTVNMIIFHFASGKLIVYSCISLLSPSSF